MSAMVAMVTTAIMSKVSDMGCHYGRAMPEKPMKASDMMPAVIKAMAVPRNGAGMSAASKRSLMAANMISTSANPADAPNPKKTE